MKVLLRKLIIGIIAVLMLSATFVSTTFAWLNLSSKATVSGFNFTASSGFGFLVSIDDINYKNNITTDEILKSMLVSYGAGEYRMSNDGDAKLFKVSYNSLNEEVLTELSSADVRKIALGDRSTDTEAKLQLYPVTSKNGRDFTDLYNSTTSITTGRYVEFKIYFKAVNRDQDTSYTQTYDIYLNGSDRLDDNGITIPKTTSTSEITNVFLKKQMETIEYVSGEKQDKTYAAGDRINIYSSNALRFSTTDESDLTEKLDEFGQVVTEEVDGVNVPVMTYASTASKIYELNDTENLNTDLGSYATDYDSVVAPPVTTDPGYPPWLKHHYLYDCDCNAMYTYYNRLRTNAPLTDRKLSYNALPETIKSLNYADNNYVKVTQVKSGEESKLVTFRFWLEGWDADCFDGLSKAISVKLSFGSKLIS